MDRLVIIALIGGLVYLASKASQGGRTPAPGGTVPDSVLTTDGNTITAAPGTHFETDKGQAHIGPAYETFFRGNVIVVPDGF